MTDPMPFETDLESIENLEDLLELDALISEEERRRGLEDLYFFDKHILGYKDMKPRTHRPVCHFVQDQDKRKKHVELPRGTFKSSVITIGYTLQSVAANPNVRILIDNEVYANSKAFLREIKGHMESERVRKLYPELEPDKRTNDGWTESSVIVKARTKQMKEPTISCAGLDQIKIGMHYDKIIMDDLVSNRNVTTKEQIEKVIEHYRLALSLLEPRGELIVVGTRYHYSDLYGYLLENEYDQFAHMILPAILNSEAAKFLMDNFETLGFTYKENDSLFPERFTPEFLAEQRGSQGTYIFNCQYMLNPVNSEEAEFLRDWLMYYKGHLVETGPRKYDLVIDWVGDSEKRPVQDIKVPFRTPIRIFSVFDPANKKKKRSDFTGAHSVAVTPMNQWFILDMIRDKYNPKEIVDRIMQQDLRYPAEITGIEEVGKDTIKTYLISEMQKRNQIFRIKELKTRGVAKEDRIRRMIPRFENKMVFLPISLERKNWEGRIINVVDWFENEYMYFPLGKTDDLIDALQYMEDIVPNVKSLNRTASGGISRRQGGARLIK